MSTLAAEMSMLAAALSLLVHAVVLLVAMMPPSVPTLPPKVEQKREATPPPPIELIATSPDGTFTCGASYLGVGVMSEHGRLIEVVPGGPADQAGLQLGDIWLNIDDFWPNQKAEGDHIRVMIVRDGRLQERIVRIGRVCY